MHAVTLLSLFGVASAHYFFPDTIYNGVKSADWQYIRDTDNDPGSGPITNMNSKQMACYQNVTKGAGQVLSVKAGSMVTFTSSNSMGHPGPQMWYVAKVPTGQDVKSWTPTGNVWTKIDQKGASGTSYVSFETNMVQINTTIPAALPSGDYLLRFEQIALHLQNPEFYVACAQITVTGGGSGTPSPSVAFPGAYSPSDPGMKAVYYQTTVPYPYPGPTPWKG